LDPETEGDLIVEIGVGDAIVLPAGVAQCSVESSGEYEYVGLYPKVCFLYITLSLLLLFPSTGPFPLPPSCIVGVVTDDDTKQGSPHWDNNFCKVGEEETKEKAENARAVPVSNWDPIFGADGPLVRIWRDAVAKSKAG
jgi:hypothetical protein